MYLCCRKNTVIVRQCALLACMAAASLAGCSIAPHQSHLGNVEVATTPGASQQSQPVETPESNYEKATGEPFDLNAEQDIATRSLAAWRTAIGHVKKPEGQTEADWQAQRKKDEADAMSALNSLAKAYPRQTSTIYMMMGQVEEHFGKRQEAAGYYWKSTDGGPISSVSLFKLAENERQLGKLDDAANHYRQLLKDQPGFYPAELGLAQCLVGKDKAEARKLAQAVLDSKPDPASQKAAEQIVSESKGNGSGR